MTTKRIEGHFRLQKFDKLLQRLIRATGLDRLSGLLRIPSSEDSFFLSSNRVQVSANELMRRQRALKRAENAHNRGQILHDNSQFKRIHRGRDSLGCGMRDFFKKDVVEDVAFEELLLIYRPGHKLMKRMGKPGEHPKAAQPIHIQRFAAVRLKDFASIFPSKKKSWNFADWFYVLVTLCWSLTLLFKLQHAWASSTYLDELALAVLFVLLPLLVRYVVTSVIRLRSDKQQEAVTSDILYNTSLNCNKAALTHVREQAVQQELNMVITVLFALYFPLSEPAVTLLQLNRKVEELLFRVTEGSVLSCDIKESTRTLENLRIVGMTPTGHGGDQLIALSPLPMAIASVRQCMLDAIAEEL